MSSLVCMVIDRHLESHLKSQPSGFSGVFATRRIFISSSRAPLTLSTSESTSKTTANIVNIYSCNCTPHTHRPQGIANHPITNVHPPCISSATISPITNCYGYVLLSLPPSFLPPPPPPSIPSNSLFRSHSPHSTASPTTPLPSFSRVSKSHSDQKYPTCPNLKSPPSLHFYPPLPPLHPLYTPHSLPQLLGKRDPAELGNAQRLEIPWMGC